MKIGTSALIMMATVLGTATMLHAHAGDGDPNKIHACVTKKGGKVRIVGADASINCKGNETPLHFAAAGEQGPPGPPGTPGRQGRSALTPLQSGETVSGTWGASVTMASGGASYRAYATFPIPLEDAIPDGNQIYVENDSAPHCPGRGQADPGFLCVYQVINFNAEVPENFNIFNTEDFDGFGGASRFGFGILLVSSSSGETAVSGTFSVTAP